ncbi:hypothetical protein HYH03_008929 [Edaphochlamys debaryana]|uniref:acylphosphatase n=1 Tax=Edaphochlamys debaryana TaxID=47281 RepID=A0A835XZV5_9CHLO|nr:hypothetical protein HYH03_008929 [Edaphochlamys debaryana]|eukprot:KAG2492764.1 hypothetical protein HYH03_008929 [Edaphochlamys debaryana]
MAGLVGVKFEVFGKVQKVFFRKHTAAEAGRLGLHGWCENTDHGTVHGEVQGPVGPVREMKRWLENKGSPASRIERAVFGPEQPLTEYSLPAFEIIRKPKA